MNIAFVDFWPSPRPFDVSNNFFVHALRACAEGIEVVDPEHCDVLFYGPFGDEHRRYRDCLKIFYTGENILPDFDNCHAALSFSPDHYGGRNLRLPLWNLYIDWFGVKSYGNPEWLVPLEWLTQEKVGDFAAAPRQNFCAIVYGKPIQSRLEAIAALSEYKSVDVLGKANPLAPVADGEWAKLQALSRYRFSLCYENSIAPGYHTEKLLHGKIAGGIPIYFGHQTVALDFNPRCYVQAVDLTSSELTERVREIDADPRLYCQLASEPLFVQTPDIAALCETLYGFIKHQPRIALACNRRVPYQLARLKRYRRDRWVFVKRTLRYWLRHLRLRRQQA